MNMYNFENKTSKNSLMSMCNVNNKIQMIAKCEIAYIQIVTSGK